MQPDFGAHIACIYFGDITMTTDASGNTEQMEFQAEVGRLLDLMVHSVYSDKEVFLRELISNASDACDKLRYAALTDTALAGEATDFKITIQPNKAERTITISDNGIGMSREDMIENLGTIARSGTAAFVEQLSGDDKKDSNLIGQFGVGFYSAFMIAERVSVLSRKAGEAIAHTWESDGRGSFSVAAAEKAATGTTITMHLREGEDEFLEPMRLRSIIKTYSDHIAIPVALVEEAAEGEEAREPETVKPPPLSGPARRARSRKSSTTNSITMSVMPWTTRGTPSIGGPRAISNIRPCCSCLTQSHSTCSTRSARTS